MQLGDEIEQHSRVTDVSYDAEADKLRVNQSNSYEYRFTETELRGIREGKLVPYETIANTVVYNVNIGLDEQQENSVNQFTFTR